MKYMVGNLPKKNKMLENMSVTIRKTAYTKHHLKEWEQAIKYLEEAKELLLKTVIKG